MEPRILYGMVELKDFVRDSIVGILGGLKEASEVAANHGGVVNPHSSVTTQRDYRDPETGDLLEFQYLEFDVAVSAIDGGKTGARVGVLAGFIGGGASAETNVEQQVTSRLRFRVPLGLPRPVRSRTE